MKTIIILFFLAFANCCFSQNNHNVTFIVEGKCYVVLNDLVKQMENDSLAVSYFFDNYIIGDSPIKKNDMKSASDIIKVFSLPIYKNTYCVSKSFYYKNTLLQYDSTTH